MVLGLEDQGIRILLNESEPISRGGDRSISPVSTTGTSIGSGASDIPPDAFSILLSHTPEVYRHAAHAGFDLLPSGHTHGGQICLPVSRSHCHQYCRGVRIGDLEVIRQSALDHPSLQSSGSDDHYRAVRA
jgi:predicted MPP superfamily phosphohydrolase